jgi:CcmD family protein
MTDTPDTYPQLFAAFAACFVLIVVYVISLGLKVSKLSKQFDELNKKS